MKTVLTFCLSFVFALGLAQQTKIPLDHSVYDSWKSITNEIISEDGNWVSYEINPQKGDGWLYLWNASNNQLDSFARGYKAVLSPNSDFLVFRIKTPEEVTRKAKKDKKKKDDMPKDSMAVFFLQKDTLLRFENIKTFSIPKENPSWITIHFEKELKKAKSDTSSAADTLKKEQNKPGNKKKKTKEKKEPGTQLALLNTNKLDTITFSNITDFALSQNGKIISFIQTNKDTIDTAQVWIFKTDNKSTFSIYNSPGIAKEITCSENGEAVAFLSTKDSVENKTFALNLWTSGSKQSFSICDTNSTNIPKKWSPSEFGNPWFSSDGSKLYFGIAPQPVNLPKDSLLEEEKAHVDIWHWKDNQIQPQQLKNLDKDKKKNYKAVYHLKSKNIVQISDTIFDNVALPFKGNGKYGILISDMAYERTATWDYPIYRDYSLINLESGRKTELAKKVKYRISLSPSEKYLYWYNQNDSAWYVKAINSENSICITCNIKVPFYDEFDDTPNLPEAWGSAGWTNNDESFLIYDRFDIWKTDPSGKTPPYTISYGRKNNVRYRYIETDREKNFIDKKENILLHTFNEVNKNEGYCYHNLRSITNESVLEKSANVSFSAKSKKSDAVLWTESTFTIYPDLLYSKEKFSNAVKISNTNPQQNKYLWGNVELVKWKSKSGQLLEGLLYKPENFDPSKKYPMISYFYEKYSDDLHRHYTPRPSRSVINFTYYTSNGYVVFIPDVKYTTGNPGENAFDCIISGIEELCKNSWIDKKHLGLQGQSWGGYQVAYLVTRTDTMFVAAMAGAPVSNMTSAYGGIRWESGMSRMFQYEKGQSRIGATLWDDLDSYIKNSPLFGVPNIKTPLLIMSNDGDGAVPWYQGIELYSALRRLSKPAWLLNYNGDEHNISKRPNMMDLTIRMQQFFDHYLKDQPAPEWMTIGLPAIKKGVDDGYKLSH